MTDEPLSLLLEDGPLLAVNKPPGLLTVGAIPGVPTLERQVKEFLRTKFQKPGNVYLGIPHRLDRPVSGVVVFARNSKCAARLAEQFRDRTVSKTYWALVPASGLPADGEWSDWLLKEPDEAAVRVVEPGTAGAREARLRFRTVATLPSEIAPGVPGALVEIQLDTGRMHQIRVQFASRGWPVWGDVQYGSPFAFGTETVVDPAVATSPEPELKTAHPDSETPDAADRDPNLQVSGIQPSPALDRRSAPIALHARQLVLKHPIRYDAITLQAPVPPCWHSRLANLPPELVTG
ncbi:MAG TPA: RNA pseudouridine synthase [Planctomycetaceae bacterium]|nr:RNA pseudouridine synthase [Planctomycetaceae bacterium]